MPSPCVAVQHSRDLRPPAEQVSVAIRVLELGELDRLISTFKGKIWELAAQVVTTSVQAEADVRASTFEPAWVDLATSLFPNMRDMTPEERDGLAEIHRQSLRPLAKPTKKQRPH